MERDLWKYLKTVKKPIVLYGMGNGADKILNVLYNYGITVSGVFATDGFVRDKVFRGFKLTSYSVLKEQYKDMVVLLCFGSGRPEVLQNINRISSEQELYAPDVPVYGEGLFTNDFLKINSEAFNRVYSLLSDDISKQTFENIINYKLSGKLSYLYDCETDENEPYESFLKLNENEDFLDLGAYTGDTVKDFTARCPDYKSITAVEPDIKSFKKLTAYAEGKRSILPINACVTDFDGETDFSMRGGRNSSVGNGASIPAITVDSVGKDTSFIKMDIEGEELKAIKGAENTIKRNKPKMQIACYHRTEDLFSIPLAVEKIRDDYKLYIRHTACVPAWDINYFFI